MSRYWLNIRFGTWHLKAGEPCWWSFRLSRNPFHAGRPEGRFAIYAPFTWPIPDPNTLGAPRRWWSWPRGRQ